MFIAASSLGLAPSADSACRRLREKPQPLEGLGREHLVQEVPVDVEEIDPVVLDIDINHRVSVHIGHLRR